MSLAMIPAHLWWHGYDVEDRYLRKAIHEVVASLRSLLPPQPESDSDDSRLDDYEDEISTMAIKVQAILSKLPTKERPNFTKTYVNGDTIKGYSRRETAQLVLEAQMRLLAGLPLDLDVDSENLNQNVEVLKVVLPAHLVDQLAETPNAGPLWADSVSLDNFDHINQIPRQKLDSYRDEFTADQRAADSPTDSVRLAVQCVLNAILWSRLADRPSPVNQINGYSDSTKNAVHQCPPPTTRSLKRYNNN